MKIKIPKPYIFVGTLATAGIIIGVTYNIIQANNDSVETSSTNKNDKTEQIQTVDYSNEIEDLKQRLIVAEEKIQTLEQEIETSKGEMENAKQEISNNTSIIASLNSKIKTLNSSNKKNSVTTDNSDTKELSKQLETITAKNNEQQELLKEKEELQEEYDVLIEKRQKFNELYGEEHSINVEISRLDNEIKLLYSMLNEQEDEKIRTKIKELEKEKESLETELKTISNQKEKYKLTDEENKKFNELGTRLTKIKEILLGY